MDATSLLKPLHTTLHSQRIMLTHSPVLGAGLVELDAPRQISARDGSFLGQASQIPDRKQRRNQ